MLSSSIWLLATLLSLQAPPAADRGRTALTVLVLQEGLHAAPVDNSAFGMPASAGAPTAVLEGRLQLLGGKAAIWTVHRDDFLRQQNPETVVLPTLDLEVIQLGNDLVPREQGIQYANGYWNTVVTPGRVWHEEGDGDWNRAGMPFALAERGQNCTHNGVLSFLFRTTSAGVEVTPAAFQVTQETCLYFKFDLAGSSATRYFPAPIPDREEIAERHRTWSAQRLEVRPISDLRRDYPTAQIRIPAFGTGLAREHLTTYGVIYGQVHYRGDSKTRFGAFPFPELEVLPSYSLAKTVFAAAALMVLAQEDGRQVTAVPLRDHLPKIGKDRLLGVTFEHAVDMATGYYRDPGEQVDEADAFTEANFFLDESAKVKLRAAISYPRKEPPGQRWVYHTTDTYLLATALGSYLGATGRTADAHRFMVERVYAPLDLSPVALKTLRTGNSDKGVPFGGFGLYLLPDDLAKLAKLWNGDRGRIGETQVLEPGMLAAALQRDPEDRGLEALHRGVAVRYNNGVWASEQTIESGNPRRRDTVWLPRMLGYGGIAVVMLPNGATYYYVGDNNQHTFTDAVRELLALPPVSVP